MPLPRTLRRPLTALVLTTALVLGSTTVGTADPVDAARPDRRGADRVEPADSYYPSKGDPRIDVRHYALGLTWRARDQRLSARARLQVTATRDTGAVRLDLHRALQVRSVRVDGRRAFFKHSGSNLAIKKRMRRGSGHEVVIRYRGHPRTVAAPTTRIDSPRAGWHTGRRGQVWTMQKPFGAYTWYPVNDTPSDKARYRITLNVPERWVGVSNGELVKKKSRKGRTKTRFNNAGLTSPHLVTVAIGPYRKQTQRGPHGLPVHYWYPRGDQHLLKPLLKTPETLEWLERRLGRYPFQRAGVIVTPGRSSVESQMLVTLGRGNYAYGKIDVREQVAHLLVHQWYGAAVTPGDWKDLWMSEGMATYLQAKFTVAEGWNTWRYWRREFGRNDQFWRTIYGPPGRWYPSEFGQRNVHYGSALMLERLKSRIGPRRFAVIMQAWPQRNLQTVRGRKTYIRFVESRSGDLGRFWREWLNAKDSPS